MKSPTNLILLLLSVGLFYTFTSPQYQEVQVLQASSAEYQDILSNVARIAETRDRLLVDYQALPKAEIARLGKVLPDNVDTVRLALDLDTIAARYGVTIKDVRVETKIDPNATLATVSDRSLPYEKAAVSFSFISSYDNFVKVLSDLERSLRVMDVRSANFRVTEAGLYEHKITVETYWLK